MAKAFLSHSSNDKNIVREVYRYLGDRLCELDEHTFEGGLPTWDVIQNAFDRCDVFVVFATQASLLSDWVDKELTEALARYRKKSIKRILIFTPTGLELRELPITLRDFAAYLTLSNPKTISLAIRRHLLALDASSHRDEAQFVGRDAEIARLKDSMLTPSKKVSGISVSGLPLLGRAALIERAMSDLYPRKHKATRIIGFHRFQSCADIGIELFGATRDLISVDQINEIRNNFQSDDPSECGRQIFNMLQELSKEDEYVIFSDEGGIIDADGTLADVPASIVRCASAQDELRVFFVTKRRPTTRARISYASMIFFDLLPFDDHASRQYVIQKARTRKIELSDDQIDHIVQIGKGHVQDLNYVLEKCKNYGATNALANVDDINFFSSERSKNFIKDIKLDDNHIYLISIFIYFFKLPAEFVPNIFKDPETGANACNDLLDRHLVIEQHGVYFISPPLVHSLSRMPIFKLSDTDIQRLSKTFSKLFAEYKEDGAAPVGMISAAGIANIEVGNANDNWSSQFILPSHYIYLSRHAYDRKKYEKALDYSESALAYRLSLTRAAAIYACRTLGMSAARLGRRDKVDAALRQLNGFGDRYARAVAAYVRGFDARLDGRFTDSENYYSEASRVLKDDASLMRELALVHLLKRNNHEALRYGRSALNRAPDNAYVIDIVIRALIETTRTRSELIDNVEIGMLLERLEHICENTNTSFFDLRSADIKWRTGQFNDALEHANRAVKRDPDLATSYLMRARVHLAKGDVANAKIDRNTAKDKTRRAHSRHAFFGAEIRRVEIDIALKEGRLDTAISLCKHLESYQTRDISDVRHAIAVVIQNSNIVLDRETIAFAKRYGSRPLHR